MKQSNMDDTAMTFQDLVETDDNCVDEDLSQYDIRTMMEERSTNPDVLEGEFPRPLTPIPSSSEGDSDMFIKGLPWTPKVRYKDIDLFLDTTRLKFVGFKLPCDRTSLAGMPDPIHEGLRVLNQVSGLSFSKSSASDWS